MIIQFNKEEIDMEKQQQMFHLPKINKKHNTTSATESGCISTTSSRPSLQTFLREVKFQQQCVKKIQQSKKEEGYRRMQNGHKIYRQLSILQKKKSDFKESVSMQRQSKDEILIQKPKPVISVHKYDTFWKPPHRYKTALTFWDDQLLLYGGFGCQKYMGLARFSLKGQEWEMPKIQSVVDHSQTSEIALYGHTMGVYRGNLYIFGGVKLESPTNQILQINLKTSEISQLVSAPFRRKKHAMTLLNKYMIVHGGIQNGNEVKNTLFYFDCESCKWSMPQQFQMPHLSHHSMVAIPQKMRKKSTAFQDILGDSVYIFGGKNQKQVSMNRLHRLRVRQTGDLSTEQIFSAGAPFPRHSACLQFIEPMYLCLFGGKGDSQDSDINQKKGIFNDCYLFDIQKKQWVVPTVNLELPFRFGASCCGYKDRMFIFGGSEINGYSDGNLLEVCIGKQKEENRDDDDEENTMRRNGLRG